MVTSKHVSNGKDRFIPGNVVDGTPFLCSHIISTFKINIFYDFYYYHFELKIYCDGAGEMAKQRRAHIASADDLNLISNTLVT